MQDLFAAGLSRNQQVIILSGGNLVQNNSTNVMSGNTFNGSVNGNIGQAGNDLSQTSNTTIGISDDQIKDTEELINEFKKFINNLPESQEKVDALNDVAQLQEAIKNKNVDRAKKIWGMFGDLVRTSSAGVSLAKIFGWI